MMCAFLAFWALIGADDRTVSRERAVTAAVLRSYFDQIHGGVGIAFPEERRPVLLHRRTVAPTREKLRVRVASPANRAATVRYEERAIKRMVARLQRRNSRHAVPLAITGYGISDARIGTCGPEFDGRRFADAVAVSAPVFEGADRALIYLEHHGGARAYFVRRTHPDRWQVDWYVELWACG